MNDAFWGVTFSAILMYYFLRMIRRDIQDYRYRKMRKAQRTKVEQQELQQLTDDVVCINTAINDGK